MKKNLQVSAAVNGLLILIVFHFRVINGYSDHHIFDFSSCNDYSVSSLSCMLRKITFKNFDDITNNTQCSTLMVDFASKVSDFVKCSVLNARPFTMCENCLEYYVNKTTVYQKLISSVDNDSTTCEDRLINSDKIQVIQQWNDAANQLWDKSKCSDCFTATVDSAGHTIYILSNHTLAFDEYLNRTLECILNQTGHLPPSPCELCEDKKVCENCVVQYKDLNKFYNGLADSVDDLCMDIVDKMNMSRTLWSEHFLCVHHKNPILSLFLCTAVVAILPVQFYVLAWYRSIKQEQCIVPQKRLLDVQGSFTASS